MREQVYHVLRIGGSRADAAIMVGVDRKTILNEERADPVFRHGLLKAEIAGKLAAILVLEEARKKTVDMRTRLDAAKFLLTHKHWEEWGLRKPGHLAPDQLADVIGQLQREILMVIPKKYHTKLAEAMNNLVKRVREMSR